MPNFLSFNKKDYGRILKYNVDWKINNGGHVLAYFERFKFLTLPLSFVFLHCFTAKGRIGKGEDGKLVADHKEFVLRFSYEVHEIPKASWFELQLVNPIEARWFYIHFKLPKSKSMNVCFNFGYRLSMASRNFIKGTITEDMMAQKAKQQKNGGATWPSRKPVFTQG